MDFDLKKVFKKKEQKPNLMGTIIFPEVEKVVQLADDNDICIVGLDHYLTCAYIYESCALFGRAKRNEMTTLVKLGVANKGKEESVVKYLQQQAKKRLDNFKKSTACSGRQEPESVFELITATEMKAFKVNLVEKDKKHIDEFFLRLIPLKTLNKEIAAIGFEGMGFGCAYPELAEKLFRNVHENGREFWPEGKAFGLPVPDPDLEKLEAREKAILTTIAKYAKKYYPELVEPCGLGGYLRN